MTEKTDDKLVLAVRSGDQGAYVELIERHYRRVFGVCMGVFGNVHDAEDAAQEAMIRGLRQIDSLRDEKQFAGWITRIARNFCIDTFRQRKRDRQLHEVQAEKIASQKKPTKTSEHDLAGAIEELPAELRGPLVMYYFENKSAKSIAKLLEISHSGACQRLRRGRQQLHELLIKQGVTE